ncbi:putative lipoprotein [[Clostridium] sordellii ATCC 9714]|nr:putative lipoprotein [[Clostridium] sordellii ATCC 9714] [Paeniclostridium sordellii ATCC 9714]
MRKFIVLITMIITTTILAGCVNSDITLDVDKKGNASLTAQILSNDTLMKGINEMI